MQGAWGAKDIFNDMAQAYVTRVNEMSGGRLVIEYLIAGAVVKPFSLQDAVNDGVLDGGHHVTAYWYGKNKAASLFGTSPVWGWNAHQGMAWIHQGGGQALYDELIQQVLGLDVVGFFAMPMPTQPLGWFKNAAQERRRSQGPEVPHGRPRRRRHAVDGHGGGAAARAARSCRRWSAA